VIAGWGRCRFRDVSPIDNIRLKTLHQFGAGIFWQSIRQNQYRSGEEQSMEEVDNQRSAVGSQRNANNLGSQIGPAF